MSSQVPNQIYTQGTGTTSTDPFITLLEPIPPSAQSINYPIGKRWVDTVTHIDYILANLVSNNGEISAHWIPLESGGPAATETLTGNSGGPVTPDGANNINVVGDGSTINIVGNPGTHTLTANVILPATAHSVLIGETSSIAGVTPDSVSGIPLISQGVFADPIFGTATVPGGGTGATSFTPYAVICGGTTSSNPLQNVSGLGTSGQILTSTGAGALPTWQDNIIGGLDWSVFSAGGALIALDYHGYVITQTTNAILNGSSTNSATIGIISKIPTGTGAVTISANAGQFISVAGVTSVATGTAVSTAIGDSLTLIYIAAESTWYATSIIGNWTIN